MDERNLDRRKASEEAIAAPMRAAVATRKVSTTANIDPMSREATAERRSPKQTSKPMRADRSIERCTRPRPLIRDARSDIARWPGKRALQNTNVKRDTGVGIGRSAPARTPKGERAAKTGAQHHEWTEAVRAGSGVERASTWRSMKIR